MSGDAEAGGDGGKETAGGMSNSNKKREEKIEDLKRELEAEQKSKDTVEWSNLELERSVRAMEANVIALESGNPDADDSEIKQKYDNQKQLNAQLQEQKRWLEHELEQVRLKIQNDKLLAIPDPFSLDWDNLSETELKRLEKTRSDLKSDLREIEWRLDKEGREYFHHNEFVKMYVAEVKNLDRILDSLARTGLIPSGFSIPSTASNSQPNSYPSTGGPTAPGSPRKGSSLSPPIGRKKVSSGLTSPRKRYPSGGGGAKSAESSSTTTVRPNAAGQNENSRRVTAGVRNLPKIERKSKKSEARSTGEGRSTRESESIPTRRSNVLSGELGPLVEEN